MAPLYIPNLPVWKGLKAVGLDVFRRGFIEMTGIVTVNGVELTPERLSLLEQITPEMVETLRQLTNLSKENKKGR